MRKILHDIKMWHYGRTMDEAIFILYKLFLTNPPKIKLIYDEDSCGDWEFSVPDRLTVEFTNTCGDLKEFIISPHYILIENKYGEDEDGYLGGKGIKQLYSLVKKLHWCEHDAIIKRDNDTEAQELLDFVTKCD